MAQRRRPRHNRVAVERSLSWDDADWAVDDAEPGIELPALGVILSTIGKQLPIGRPLEHQTAGS
jgi:hypothetical protein